VPSSVEHHDRTPDLVEHRDQVDASEIRIRAERRLGEMIKAQKDDAGLNKGGRPKTSTPEEQVLKTTPTLEDVGISRKLSSRAQAIASIPARTSTCLSGASTTR
jgi:hypothetical protein